MNETWRPVKVRGYEHLYEISSLGRVRSIRKNAILKPVVDGRGYFRVTLCNGRSTNRKVHLLVLEAFIGPRPTGKQSGHLDGKKENNVALNLAWITASQNTRQAILDGQFTPPVFQGQEHKMAKLTQAEVNEIRALVSRPRLELAKRYGVSRSQIQRIIHGKCWKEQRDGASRML